MTDKNSAIVIGLVPLARKSWIQQRTKVASEEDVESLANSVGGEGIGVVGGEVAALWAVRVPGVNGDDGERVTKL